MSTTPIPNPPPTLASLLAAITADQANISGASLTVTNDGNAVAAATANVTTAQTTLAAAQAAQAAAEAQQDTDNAALLPDALQLQADVNALVTFLQPPPPAGA